MRAGRAEHAARRDAGAAAPEATPAQPGSPLVGRVRALQRQVGNRATTRALSRLEVPVPPVLPPLGVGPTTPELSLLARPGYVFLMGSDAAFEGARKYYEKYRSGATIVDDKRSLGDVLEYISRIPKAAGEIYIVSHGAEDGTMFMGLRQGDTTGPVTPADLEAAIGSLPTPGYDKVDDATRIHIRGCNIGRTKKMVELLDEAFNGYARVDAPTHETGYGYVGDDAWQEFSGPLFDRVGTTLYTEAELVALLKQNYPHLPEAQVNALAKKLAAKDARTATTIAESGTYGQQGQRVDAVQGSAFEFNDPKTVAAAVRLWGPKFKANHFTPDTPTKAKPDSDIVRRKETPSGKKKVEISHEIDGTLTNGTTRAFTETMKGDVIDTDAVLIEDAKSANAKADEYTWRVKEEHDAKSGKTKRMAVGERVIAYLHHGSLNASASQHFFRLEGEDQKGEYYTRSTHQPEKLPAPAPSKLEPLPPGGNPFPPSKQ